MEEVQKGKPNHARKSISQSKLHSLGQSQVSGKFPLLIMKCGEGDGTHSSTVAWKISWMEEPGGLQSVGSLRVRHDFSERLHFHFSLSYIGEGKGNPLQCSCLENPRDREAWWAAVYGVAQSRTRLRRLSSSSKREKLPATK